MLYYNITMVSSNLWIVKKVQIMSNSLSKFNLKHNIIPLTSGLVLALSACQPANHTDSGEQSAVHTQSASAVVAKNAHPVIYASTNLWAAVAQAVAGDSAQVIAAVDNPAQDPHGYQASARDKANMQQAAVVLMNGGGYDDWAQQIAQSLDPAPRVLNAVAISQPHANTSHVQENTATHTHDTSDGHPYHHHHGEQNEHVFYQLAAVQQVANAIAQELSTANPTQQTTYQQNAAAFNTQLDQLKIEAQKIGQGKHLQALATEPVADFLLADMGMTNVTPPEFINQLANDEGVSVKALHTAEQLLAQQQVDILVLNAQTEDPASRALRKMAEKMHIPVVTVYETLPTDTTNYIDFMRATIERFAAASQETPKTRADN